MANSKDDPSNGYEAVATEYIRRRTASTIGIEVVSGWSRLLPKGAAILDLGCGSGVPISAMLDAEGFAVYGVDASEHMTAAFRRRLPHAHAACEPVEMSRFFDRTFDGVVAIGLMFLLRPDAQRDLIRKVATVLEPDGRFLFSAPTQSSPWIDVLTGLESRSLGTEDYEAAFKDAGLTLVGTYVDEGENHHFDTQRLNMGSAYQPPSRHDSSREH